MNLDSMTPSQTPSPKNPIHYEESSKAKSLGIFSGFAKSRLVLNDVDNNIIKIAAVKISDLNTPVTTTFFFFKTHVRVKIGDDHYDVNISSTAKRLGITKEKAEDLLRNEGTFNQEVTNLQMNLKDLSTKLKNIFYKDNIQPNKNHEASHVIDFLSENKEELVQLSSKDQTKSYQVKDFTIEVSKNSIRLTKQGARDCLFLDPLNPLKVESLDISNFEETFNNLKTKKADYQAASLNRLSEKNIDLFLEFAKYCAEKETPLQDLKSLFRDQSITITIYKTLMNKAIGDKLKQEVKDFLKKHPILYTPEHEKYKQEAEIFLPQFFDKVKDIIQELPFPLKQYHTMLRDNAKKLFIDKAKINAEDAQNEANKFIITPLFLRIIAPMITLENATGTSALLQNLANQITQNIKPNQWSFFTSTINQMQMDGKYSAYLGVLLA